MQNWYTSCSAQVSNGLGINSEISDHSIPDQSKRITLNKNRVGVFSFEYRLEEGGRQKEYLAISTSSERFRIASKTEGLEPESFTVPVGVFQHQNFEGFQGTPQQMRTMLKIREILSQAEVDNNLCYNDELREGMLVFLSSRSFLVSAICKIQHILQ